MLASTSGQSFVLPDGREVLVSYDDEGECQMEVRSANPNEDVWTPRRRVGNGAVGKVLREGGGGRVVRLGQSEDDKLCAKSLMYFRQSHWLRRWCIAIWRNPNFEVFIILLIFANCATIAYECTSWPMSHAAATAIAGWYELGLCFLLVRSQPASKQQTLYVRTVQLGSP